MSLLYSQCAPKPYTKTIASEKKWPLFKFGKEKSLCQKKKFCNQNLKKKIKILFSGSGLHYWITKKHNNPEFGFQLAIFLPVFVFVKTKKFPFQMSKYKKRKKKQPCVYIRKEEKTNQKTSIAPAAVISQKKTSL